MNASLSILRCTTSIIVPQPDQGELLAGFRNPPDTARPRVWWHWMSGNIIWEGAKADIDWMKHVGIVDTPYGADAPLRASGRNGPVKIYREDVQ
jgi:hypothetical protein